ncbi:MAG: tetratricopeptide repeat protein [Balneolaceae bacterium]|nr:tetratricopeptide repeat protein [Balneolaceae bacterium]MBO6547531.1 tetratricopeptide repeat protein [Balneolaceae bacterium]MBO6648043.1 tetratricopeptide repeat protein [Balneolaceae bacterium]
MRKLIGVFLVVLFFSGCKTSFKSSFRDFNAYYNTFYNAKKSFSQGQKRSDEQGRNYNTLQPIRIHETPMGAGSGDFQNAIDKGADILRKYDETKWVDDALEIIGKSYFYRREYFSADQKFDELYLSTENQVMKQRAVYWKGRALLELQVHNQGVQYLTEELALFDGEWKEGLEYQVRAVLGQHYVERENWVNALDQLVIAVPELPKKEYKERGYFLIGQLHEILGNNEEAFEAYNKVTKNYTNYDIQFEAQKKKAEVARKLGNSEEAYKVFSSMVRDDKNTEFISELNFELGKTEQDRGNYKRAEEIYIRILRDQRIKPGAVIRARIYNGLAEINRFEYNDYESAAAYYDSASSMNANEQELPEDFNAKEFASSFGEYARLKNEIYLQDSLLWLGQLPQDKFDSVLVVLENQKREEIAQLQREQEERRNTLINVDASGNQNTQQQNTERNGFLGNKNPVMLAEASQQFNALWGSRPLVDNWRVSSLIVNDVQAQNEADTENQGLNTGEAGQVFVSIDLSRVPFAPKEQDSVREDLSTLHYELANLFFLSLNLPDSAETYFNKILEERPNSEVVPVSLYSLSELYAIRNENINAEETARELLNRFPNSVYADRVIETYGFERPEVLDEVVEDPRSEYFSIVQYEALNDTSKAEMFSEFEENYRGLKIAGRALFDGIQTYIAIAKKDSGFTEAIAEWNQLNEEWKTRINSFEIEKDSARIALSDTNIANSDSLYFSGLLDSTLTEPEFKDVFPYRGTYWDSTRSKINLFLSNYSTSVYANQVKTLELEFEFPVDPSTENPVEVTPELNPSTDYVSCDDIDQNVFIRGGTDNFLEFVEIPSGIQEDEISFLFFINFRGIIDEFKLASDTQNQELINAFVKGIEEYVSFDPVLVEGEATPVSCEVRFTFEN